MARVDVSPLRITTWPTRPVEEHPALLILFSVRRGGWLYWEDEPDWMDHRALPAEFVLRGLGAIDVNNNDDVIAALRAHGSITQRYHGLVRNPACLGVPRNPPRPEGIQNHVREAAAYLLSAQTLVDHWVAWTKQESVEAAWHRRGFTTIASDSDAWSWFETMLNRGLRDFNPRVEVDIRDRGEVHELGRPEPSLYGALCLQLLNIISEDLPPMKCLNETCSNYFVRQSGRAKADQFRASGNKYCDAKCAKAQAQRVYRRRARSSKRTRGG